MLHVGGNFKKMEQLKLDKYEINFLTEPFPLSLSSVKGLFESDSGMYHYEAIEEAEKMLKRFYDLGYIAFHVWLFYKKGEKIKIVLNEPEHGYKLAADKEFWLSLNEEDEIWNWLSSDKVEKSERAWDIGVDLTDKFRQEYLEPDDIKFWKLINQE